MAFYFEPKVGIFYLKLTSGHRNKIGFVEWVILVNTSKSDSNNHSSSDSNSSSAGSSCSSTASNFRFILTYS